MIFAQIKDGIVQNCIVLNDTDIQDLFLEGYDFLIQVDDLDPQPGIGYSYDGVNFTAPPNPPPEECDC